MSQATAINPTPHVSTEMPRTRSQASRRLLRAVLMLGGIAVVAIGGSTLWLMGGRYVSIDNAYVRAAKMSLSTDVSGIVAEVPVREGQHVKKGDVLLRIAPRKFQIALDGALANQQQAVLTIESMKRDYQRMLRDTEVRQAQLANNESILERASSLVGTGANSRAQHDSARFAVQADLAAVEALRTQAEVHLAKLNNKADLHPRESALYLQALAQVDEAKRQLEQSTIRAPFDGIVTQVDSVQPGMYLAAATAAFGIISTERVWIDASPKETEITYIRLNNKVKVTVDTYPGHVWSGTICSISPNSGAEFSILPAQNTSGNWVKVVQRIPLRVCIERHPGDPDLRAGMSVIAEIDTRHKRSINDLWPQ
ncbi:MAG: HlyD family secretion protein [Acetobacteraceae bacterium]|nr:HlyD family secretion protein [Acetobacteraceae bacterium]